MNPNVLEIDGLTVSFFTDEGEAKAVNGVRFAVPRGKVLALVGESGCGKSVTSYSILRLIQKPGGSPADISVITARTAWSWISPRFRRKIRVFTRYAATALR